MIRKHMMQPLALMALSAAVLPQSSLANEAIRDYYDAPGIQGPRQLASQHFDEQVNRFTGELDFVMRTLSIPGNGGLDIELKHVYSTPERFLQDFSPYGYGWNMHLGRLVVGRTNEDLICQQDNSFDTLDNPSWEFPDGRRETFVAADDYEPDLITRSMWSLECQAGGDFVVQSPDGTTYELNQRARQDSPVFFYVTRIEDANGNSLEIDYERARAGFAYMTRITASDGREVVFNYSSDDRGKRLKSIEGPDDQFWTFDYEFSEDTAPAMALLSRVDRPDGDNWAYEYTDKSSGEPGYLAVSRVTLPWGGRFAYSYDGVDFNPEDDDINETVVSRRVQDGRDVTRGVWDFSYSPAWRSASGFDVTTIDTPTKQKRFFHYGFSNTASDQLWRVGLKAFEETYTEGGGELLAQKELTYTPIVISDERFWHGFEPSDIDQNTVLPKVSERRHFREGQAVRTIRSDFNKYGQPGTVRETSNIIDWPDRVTERTFRNDPASWILGLETSRRLEHDIGPAPARTWTRTQRYDDAGNRVRRDANGVVTEWTYTDAGDIASRTDARGNTTRFRDHKRSIATREERPDGTTISRTVNDSGTLAALTDARGNTTTFAYDGLRRVTRIDRPARAAIDIGYDGEGWTIQRGDYRKSIDWNGFAKRMDVTREDLGSGRSVTVRRERDAVNRVTFRSKPGRSTGNRYTYDALDRREKVRHGDGTEKTYDYPTAATKVVTDENGNTTTRRWGLIGTMDDRLLIDIESPENIVTFLKYDARGELVQVAQGRGTGDNQLRGFQRNFRYDSRGYLVRADHPEIDPIRFERDALGNVTERQVGSDAPVQRFSYDSLNRRIGKSYSDVTPSVELDYDPNGNLVRLERGSSVREYDYDANDNLIGERLRLDGRTYKVDYERDRLGHVSALTYPSGRTVRFAPDALGDRKQATPYVNRVTHHPDGQVERMTYANGTTTRVAVDRRSRLTGLEVSGPTGSLLDLTYRYDKRRNVTAIDSALGTQRDRTMRYDAVNRLTEVTGPWGTRRYRYDSRGNITAETLRRRLTNESQTTNYAYNGERLTAKVLAGLGIVTQEYTYNQRGQVTNDGSTFMSYDAAGNLRWAWSQGMTTNFGTRYRYDGAGRRVQRKEGRQRLDLFYTKSGRLLGAYQRSGGFREYIYAGGMQAAKVEDDSRVIGE